jgi:hypothetical protein
MHENLNVVCNEEKNGSSSTVNVQTKRKRCDNEASAKLWHDCLGHILRGRIERLIKEKILHPLDFSDKEYCIDCIKGSMLNKLRKEPNKV